VRYALEKRFMHACRDNFCSEITHREEYGIAKRDIAPNINFFMNVPVTRDGKLTFEDGISAAGKYVEMRAEMDRDLPDLELPAAQQSVQCLQTDADSVADLGSDKA
jgi:hypothetical protein